MATFCFDWLKRYAGSDRFVAAGQPAVIVMDASVLMNFLRIDRMDLIAGHSHGFVVTDHVAAEISDRYPEQQQRFSEATDRGAVSQTSITSPEELPLFGSLSVSGRLGAGECSAIAMAVHRRFALAIDDRQATAQARRTDRTLRVLTTQDLMVSMIGDALLDIAEADRIKDEWAAGHRFSLKLVSFRDICP